MYSACPLVLSFDAHNYEWHCHWFVSAVSFMLMLSCNVQQELEHDVPKPLFSGPSSFIPTNEVNPVILVILIATGIL